MSLFIPTFNAGSILAEAVRTALEQSTPVQTVVVDNGSTDGSVADSDAPLNRAR